MGERERESRGERVYLKFHSFLLIDANANTRNEKN